MATYYEVLGVAPGATHDEIQRAYRRLAREHHPDTKVGEGHAATEHARQVMASVNAAWTVLGDAGRRADYDRRLNPPRATAPADDGFRPEHEPQVVGGPDDESDSAPPSGQNLVLLPVAVFAVSVGSFALSVMMQSPFLMTAAMVLFALAAASFVLMPFVLMQRRARTTLRRPAA